ncbi:MAG: nucleotidyl transferase AbiEii/AbiGii toxin family protein [Bacteroidetes bacterium]|nr:MAG: nucleotidyl transferase AbiEii/AbiGii toxin family protein [Bacteroidota bacterium]
MKLHENKELFIDAVKVTAQQTGLPEIYVEKDYWVSYALFVIFHSEMQNSVVFKGGTALSKSFKLIERFSEDIDLVLLKEGGESGNKLKGKLKKISESVSEYLPEFELEGITKKMGMNRKTAHSYHHSFAGNYGQVRNCIILETTVFGNHEPFSKQKLSSFIYDMMINTGQAKLAEEYGMQAFDVQVLNPIRTICEKVMSLIRFSYSETPIESLKAKVRHIYDINQLMKDKRIITFFNSSDFDTMLMKVAEDDMSSNRNNYDWLSKHPKDAIIFADYRSIWKEISVTYNGRFKSLVYGALPDNEEILSTLNKVSKRLKLMDWILSEK